MPSTPNSRDARSRTIGTKKLRQRGKLAKWILGLEDPTFAPGERIIRDELGSLSRGLYYRQGRILLTDKRLLLIPARALPIRFLPISRTREIPLETLQHVTKVSGFRALLHLRLAVLDLQVADESHYYVWTANLDSFVSALEHLARQRGNQRAHAQFLGHP